LFNLTQSGVAKLDHFIEGVFKLKEELLPVLNDFPLLRHHPQQRTPLVDGKSRALDLAVQDFEVFAGRRHVASVKSHPWVGSQSVSVVSPRNFPVLFNIFRLLLVDARHRIAGQAVCLQQLVEFSVETQRSPVRCA
jgi:hypothetical protein